MRFFNYDGPVVQTINKFFDAVFLSLLWVIFCIPLFTIGASTSALYSTANKVLRHERGYVFRQFWESFKSCFKQSTLVWLLVLVISFIMISDIRILNVLMPNMAGAVFKAVFVAILIFIALLIQFIFAYVARFKAPLKAVIKNSMIIAIRHLPWTILLTLWMAVVIMAEYIIPLSIFILPCGWALIASLMIERIFKRYMTAEDLEMEEMRNSRNPR